MIHINIKLYWLVIELCVLQIIWTVIVLVIKQTGLSLRGHLILLITGMIYPY